MDWGKDAGRNLSLYISVPFCRQKCSYCDLNAYTGLEALIPSYVAALIKEVRLVAGYADEAVHTVYFGGGTPSITPLPLLAGLLAAIRDSFALLDACEISFEANPEALDEGYLVGLRALGVNRLSIGAQSAQLNELALFQRTHTFDDVVSAVTLARRAGFQNLGLDLIYGAPGQTFASWQNTLARAIALDPDHFSIYALSLDFNTPMRAWVQRGLLAKPDDDLAAEMYEQADEALGQAGYEQYEISSWARTSDQLSVTSYRTASELMTDHLPQTTDFQCRHNLQYWRNQPYLGLGAGAHGYYGGFRYANVASPTAYVRRMESSADKPFRFSPAVGQRSQIDRQTEMNETMLTGLRLVGEGVANENFRARFGIGIEEVYAVELEELKRRKLVEWNEAGARLTREGRLVANWVFELFV